MTSEERTLEELLKEILRLNHDKPKICDLVNKGILSAQVNKVMKAFENDSEVFPQGNEIKYWNKVNIRNWADSIKGTEITKNPEFLEEMIAVLKRTNILYCNHNLRITQVLAILLFASPNEQGRLLQISTGEGKTTICAMLASIKALQGENVDIITSSPILAKRDAEERESFYKILGISCGSNEGEGMEYYSLNIVDGRNGIQLEINKNCYFKNIVYGDVSEFQFDWLRHEHKKMGTKGNRGFGVVIVDEVDNMIIDDCSRSARLTGELAGFEYLNPVFCGVANELTKLSKRIIRMEENLIYIDGEFKEEGGELILGEGIKCYEIDNLYEFVSEHLTEFTINIIKERKIELPDFLRDFCLKSVEEFVKSAIESWNVYQERIEYLTVKGKDENSNIAPVDYESTGIVQENETFSDGLHQFLQIKHGLKLTPESVATSFVSNMGYFKKYGAKIYGLTGTIGSKEDQDMLSSIYTVDFGFIPTYKAKKFKELEGIVTSNKNVWIMEVVSNIKQEGERGRAVLVICETIDDVRTIYDILIEVYSTKKIRLYSRNDNDECSAVKERVNSGDVIIATNLAGRGTDIKTSSSVEKNGGLHVIVTFLPSNSRVEEQAFGRTARQGAKGTAQLIINKIYTENKLNTTGILSNIYEFKQLRDSKEYIRIQTARLYKAEEVELRDKLFEIYLEVDNDLREMEENKKEEKTISDILEKDKRYKYKLLQVEERWGLELKIFEKTLAYNSKTREELKQVAKKFGFKPYGNNEAIFSLYKAISVSLENKASSEQLLWLAVGYFLDNFTEMYHHDDINFYEKAAKSFSDKEALKSLTSVLRRNIVVISSNQENSKSYKIKDVKETIYIGLEDGSKKYFRNYRPLRKVSDNNDTIEKYPIKVEVKATEYKSITNLFERKDLKKLIDEIIKQESKEVEECNLVKRNEGISYFKNFFNEIKEEYKTGNKIMKNSAYMVRMGIERSEVKEKIDILEGACNLEKIYSLPARYNLAHAVIEEQEGDYKQKAVKNLSIAKNQIDEILIPYLEYIQITLPLGQSCELSKQMINNIEILKAIKCNIEETIKKISSDSEAKIKINKVRLDDYFNKDKNLNIEIRELENEGLYYIFDVEFEIDWFGVIFLGIAGVVQIGIGALCLYKGLDELGTFFIEEGVKDLINMVKLLTKKQKFDLNNYISEKAISISIGLVLLGAKTVLSKLRKLPKEIPNNSSSSSNSLIKSLLKKIGKNVLIKECIHTLLDTSADEFVSLFKEKVKENILKELRVSLDDQTILIYLNKLIAIDILFEGGELDEIAASTLKILEDKRNMFRKLIDEGLEEIIKGKHPVFKEIAIAAKVADSTIILSEINKVAKEAAKEISTTFKNKIKESYKQQTFETILERGLKPKIDLEDAKEIIMLLKKDKVINDEEFDEDKAQEIDFKQYNNHKLEIIGILSIYNKLRKKEYSYKVKEGLIEKYEDYITKFVLNKIKTRALGCLTNVMTDKLTDYINDKIKGEWDKFRKERTQNLKSKTSLKLAEEYSRKKELDKKSKLEITKILKANFKKNR